MNTLLARLCRGLAVVCAAACPGAVEATVVDLLEPADAFVLQGGEAAETAAAGNGAWRWSFDGSDAAPHLQARTYRGEMRSGVEAGQGVAGSHAYCMRAAAPVDADLQVRLLVSPGTRYRLRAALRPIGLEPTTAEVYGTIYLGEFDYARLDGDSNDPVVWHRDLDRHRGGGEWRPLEYEFETHRRTRMLRLAVSLGNWGEARGGLCVDDIWLEQVGEPVAGSRVQVAEIDRELRRGLRVGSGEALSRAVDVPPAGRLAFGYGVEKGVRFDRKAKLQVVAVEGATRRELFSQRVRDRKRWHDVVLDLAEYAGRKISLEFRVEPHHGKMARESSAIFANPVLFTPIAAGQDKSILLLTIDTLRSDHLGFAGYSRDVSPHLDSLAADGIVFENAFTTVPRTTPALASLMTSTHPRTHGVRTLLHRLPSERKTLAETLSALGYQTGAIVTHNTARQSGLDQGFATFYDGHRLFVRDPRARASVLVDRAIEWWRQRRGMPRFLWLHVWDPHFPYDPPAPYDSLFDPDYSGDFSLYRRMALGEVEAGEIYFENDLSARDRQHAIALYDGEIRYTDEEVGRLLDELRRSAEYDGTMVVFTSDHGESLGEHDYYYEHGDYLYDDGLRIPLVVKLAENAQSGTRRAHPASILDIAPTLLGFVGAAMPGVVGVDLAAAPEAAAGRRLTYAESGRVFVEQNPRRPLDGLEGHWRSVRQGPWKLVEIPTGAAPQYELYRTDRDPGEIDDLSGTEPDRRKALAKRLHDWLGGFAAEPEGAGRELSEAEKERLRALGYMN